MTIVASDTNAAFVTNMAGSATGVGKGNSEDVSDIVYNISPESTPLLSMLPRTKASGKYHEWLTDTLAAGAANAKDEGALFASDDLEGRSRVSNPCVISYRVYEVTGTQEAVSKKGVKSELAYQAAKKMKEIKKDIDYQLWLGSAAQGDTADMSAMNNDGFDHLAKNHVSAHTGTTSFATAALTGDVAEAAFNTMLQDIWDDGGEPTMAFMPGVVKRLISRWTGVATKYYDQKEKKILNVVDWYVSDFGEVQFAIDRQMDAALIQGDVQIFAGDFSNAAVAYLRPLQAKGLVTPKDTTAGVVLTEYTLEYGDKNAYGWMKCST
jgi:hypothetical protein